MKTAKEVILHLASIPGIQVLGLLVTFLGSYFGISFLVLTILPLWGIVMFPYDCGLGIALFSFFISISLMMIAVIIVGIIKVSTMYQPAKTPLSVFLTALGAATFFAAPIFGAVISVFKGWEAGMDAYLLVGLGGALLAILSGIFTIPHIPDC